MKDSRESFKAGFEFWMEHEEELTARQISTMFPDMRVIAFQEGQEDARNEDHYRYERIA